MDFSKVKEFTYIKHIGDSTIFFGEYLVVTAESTYDEVDDCPEHEKGKLMIFGLMEDGVGMFFTLDKLNADEWEVGDLNGE